MSWKWTPEDIAEEAQGTLEEWFQTYTDFLEDGRQRRIKLVLREDGDVGYRVYEIVPMDAHGMPVEAEAERFKITITAEKFDG
jgi:hypothetical protein